MNRRRWRRRMEGENARWRIVGEESNRKWGGLKREDAWRRIKKGGRLR